MDLLKGYKGVLRNVHDTRARFTCTLIADKLGYFERNKYWSLFGPLQFEEVGKPTQILSSDALFDGGEWPGADIREEARYQWRQTALCFVIAMIKAGDWE
jgi:hypothetical protein